MGSVGNTKELNLAMRREAEKGAMKKDRRVEKKRRLLWRKHKEWGEKVEENHTPGGHSNEKAKNSERFTMEGHKIGGRVRIVG